LFSFFELLPNIVNLSYMDDPLNTGYSKSKR